MLTQPTKSVTSAVDCNGRENMLRNCFPYYLETEDEDSVAGLNCDCTNKDLRLADGPSYREGRVAVCMNGQWRSVCVEGSGNTEAGLICARLGFPSDGAIIIQYNQGTLQSIYNLTCLSHQSGPPDCTAIPAPNSCDHSMDLGVRCLTYQEVCDSMDDESDATETISVTEVTTQKPSSTLSSSSSSSGPVSSTVSTKSTQAIHSSCICSTMPEDGLSVPSEREFTSLEQFSKELLTTNKTLGALTGLLTAALVVVTMGWIVSCVYWQRRNKQGKDSTIKTNTDSTSRQLDNPVYDGRPVDGTHSQTNYSSTGPAYEHVEANERTGYDVINRRGAPRPHPPMTPPGSHDPTSDQDYSILEGNNYHVLESSNMTDEGNSGVRDNARHVQSQGGNNQLEHSNGHDPQDYEIPAPRSSMVQNI